MEDTLISFETAKLAKDKGFNIETKHWYDQTTALNPIKGARGAMDYQNIGYAPTQSLLQKWLREKHNIIITVASIFTDETHTEIRYWWWIQGHEDDENEEEIYFETYELSLESALKEALNLLSPKII